MAVIFQNLHEFVVQLLIGRSFRKVPFCNSVEKREVGGSIFICGSFSIQSELVFEELLDKLTAIQAGKELKRKMLLTPHLWRGLQRHIKSADR
jgi:hypothetical protein